MFSAPSFVVSNVGALLKPAVNPSLVLDTGLKHLEPSASPCNRVPGLANGEEGSADVGERANARGGEEERMTIADIVGRPLSAHWGRLMSANAIQSSHQLSRGCKSCGQRRGTEWNVQAALL